MKFKIYTLILSVLYGIQALSIDAGLKNIIAKNSLHTIFDRAVHICSWMILSYPIYNAYERYTVFNACAKHASSATKEQIDFVRDTLKEQHFPESLYQNISIHDGPWCSQPQSMSVAFNPITDSPQDLHEAKGLIAHEGSHIYHKDEYRYWAISIAAPLILEYITYLGGFNKSSVNSTVRRSLGRIPLAFFNLAIGSCISTLYARHREHVADLGVIQRVNDPRVLEALQNRFYRIYQYVYQTDSCPAQISWYDRITWIMYSGELFHPHPLDRAQHFKRATEHLKVN